MEKQEELKKQTIYPPMLSRIISTLIDMTLLTVVLSQMIPYLNLYIFKYNFANILAEKNLTINTPYELDAAIRTQELYTILPQDQLILTLIELTILQFALFSIYFVFCWVKYGVTLGKLLLKMKVQDYSTGKNPTIHKAILRYFGYLFAPISILFMFTKEKRTIHDYLSGTIVIKN